MNPMAKVRKIAKGLSGVLAEGFTSGQVIQEDVDMSVTLYETDSETKAIAKCAEFLGDPSVPRVEVRIGRGLAAQTNVEKFRKGAKQQASEFVSGRQGYDLSIEWSDYLDNQDLIAVKVYRRKSRNRRSTAFHAAQQSSLSEKEAQAVRQELIDEIDFQLKLIKEQFGKKVALVGLDVVCQDAAYDSYLATIAANSQEWTKSIAGRLQRDADVTLLPEFQAGYRFETVQLTTMPVGQGMLGVELFVAGSGRCATRFAAGPMRVDPTTRENEAAQTGRGEEFADDGANTQGKTEVIGTFDIGDEHLFSSPPSALITWRGVGAQRIADSAPVRMTLPGVINRSFLENTSIAEREPHCLKVVSESKYPLAVGIENGCLVLTAKVKHKEGTDKPTHYLVCDGAEMPLVGKKRIPSGRAEVLIGGESGIAALDQSGNLLRPVRIEIQLQADGAV